jgi:hypothetical protein
MTLLQFLTGLAILSLAGFSDSLGQSAVLFLNRVPPRRFLLCLISGMALFLGSASTWALSCWLLGQAFSLPLPFGRCCWLVALAHLPLLGGALVLLPHFGSYLFQALRAWVFFSLVAAMVWTTRCSLPLSIAVCLPGWLLHFSVTHLRLWRLERFQVWLWNLLA